jgi:hypothetical protein
LLAEASAEKLAAAEAAKSAAEAELSSADARRNEAMAAEPLKSAESFEAVRHWKEASSQAAAAAAKLKEAGRRASPVSVLVSKKDQRVYVRQALAPLLEAPASVRDPDVPLGSHVYIASAIQEDGTSLKWSVISMPRTAGDRAVSDKRKKASRGEVNPVDVPRPQASSPAEALERIEIPAEIRERISELLWTGGSLIITDNSLSGETSDDGTDLVVNVR